MIKKTNRTVFAIGIILFLFNIITKLFFLDMRDIANDEPFSIFHSQKSISEILDLMKDENNPPLHFIFLHFWIKLFGIEPFAVRLPSVIFSSLAAVLIFSTGKRFFNIQTGVFAALIFSLSAMHLSFSHEARVYPMFVLLTSASLYYFLSAINDHTKRKNYFFLLTLNCLLIYSHYFGWFVIFMEFVCIFFISAKKRMYKPMSVIFIILFASYLPIVFIFIHRFSVSVNQGTWVQPPHFTEVYGNLNRFINSKYCMLVLIFIFLVGVISQLKTRSAFQMIKSFFQNDNAKVIFLCFISSYLTMFIAAYKVPMFIDRYILFITVPFYLLIAITVQQLFSKNNLLLYSAISVFVACLAYTLNLNPDNNRRLNETANEVKKLKKQDTPVLICPYYADLGFIYYYNREYFKDYKKMYSLLEKEKIFSVSNNMQVNAIIADSKECIYVQADSWYIDPENLIFKNLESKFKKHELKEIFEIYKVHYFFK